MFIILSPILAMMDMWGLFAHAMLELNLSKLYIRSYKNYGLKGQFELEKYEKKLYKCRRICNPWYLH